VTAELAPPGTAFDGNFTIALCPTSLRQQDWEQHIGDFSNLLALGYPTKSIDKDAGRPLIHSMAVSMKNLYEMKGSITNAGDEYAASFFQLSDFEPAKQATCMLVIRPSVDSAAGLVNLKLKIEYLIMPRSVKPPPLDARVVTPTPPGDTF
jgi:hypothetical protein